MSAAHNLPAPTSEVATPRNRPSGRDQTSSGSQDQYDTQSVLAAAAPTTGTDQSGGDTHRWSVGSGPFSAPAATSTGATTMVAPSRRDADPTSEDES